MSQLSLFDEPPPLTRDAAIELLTPYLGHNLRSISDELGVTKNDRPVHHTGWAGHTIEWMLGSAPNNVRAPDFGDWELKVTTVEPSAKGGWRPRGAMSITQLKTSELRECSFEASHLLAKTKHMLIPCRSYSSIEEWESTLVQLCTYDLPRSTEVRLQSEYEALRWTLNEHGVTALSEVVTDLLSIQACEGGRSWRFIARRQWVEEMTQSATKSLDSTTD